MVIFRCHEDVAVKQFYGCGPGLRVFVFELSMLGDQGWYHALIKDREIKGRDINDRDFGPGVRRRGQEDLVDEIDDRGTNSYSTSAGDDKSYFLWDCVRHRGFLVGARASLCCRREAGQY